MTFGQVKKNGTNRRWFYEDLSNKKIPCPVKKEQKEINFKWQDMGPPASTLSLIIRIVRLRVNRTLPAFYADRFPEIKTLPIVVILINKHHILIYSLIYISLSDREFLKGQGLLRSRGRVAWRGKKAAGIREVTAANGKIVKVPSPGNETRLIVFQTPSGAVEKVNSISNHLGKAGHQ